MSDTFGHRLIENIRSGQEEALAELYRRHAQVLYNYAARVLMSAEEAGDVLAGVFQSVWCGVPAWPDPAPPSGVVLAERMRELLLGKMRGAGKRPYRDVDLWSIVSSRGEDPPAVQAACAAIRKSGVVSTAVLTMVYFGGRTIADTAERLTMTESEARSRLQVGLERLAGDGEGGRRPAPHGGKFLVNAAAWALGAVAPIEEPGYAHHLADGCPECRAEIERYSSAAHVLPSLLPDVNLPEELLEKILFSVRLAGVAASGDAAKPGPARTPEKGRSPMLTGESENPHPAAGPTANPIVRTWRRFAMAGGGVAVAAIILLGSYAKTLSGRIEEQSGLVESLADRNTELLLKYDRLAGISGFFESNGTVTLLSGTYDAPGLSGKIVWDTTGKSAMLQILNAPAAIRHCSIRVRAISGGDAVRIAEFRGEGADSGSVFYRIFPVESGPEFHATGFVVDVSPESADPDGSYRTLLRSATAPR
jgi:RNA polymerase sigma-70 factor (ECF subfamily)